MPDHLTPGTYVRRTPAYCRRIGLSATNSLHNQIGIVREAGYRGAYIPTPPEDANYVTVEWHAVTGAKPPARLIIGRLHYVVNARMEDLETVPEAEVAVLALAGVGDCP